MSVDYSQYVQMIGPSADLDVLQAEIAAASPWSCIAAPRIVRRHGDDAQLVVFFTSSRAIPKRATDALSLRFPRVAFLHSWLDYSTDACGALLCLGDTVVETTPHSDPEAGPLLEDARGTLDFEPVEAWLRATFQQHFARHDLPLHPLAQPDL